MLTLRRFKGTILTALMILLIGTAVAYAHHYDVAQGYIDLPTSTGDQNPGSIYWNIAIGDAYFAGRNSHSGHSYAIENYSNYALSVTWEYAHKVMRPDNTLYENDSEHDTITVNPDRDSYGRGERGVSVVPGSYYLDTYTSVDILYAQRRPNIPKRIKYKKLPIVTSVTTVL